MRMIRYITASDEEYLQSVAYQLFIRGYEPKDVQDFIDGIRYGNDEQIAITLDGIPKSELLEIKDILEDMISAVGE